jgi:methyltransferase
MAQLSLAERMEQAIRKYIQACNNGDAASISACFRADAVHYAPGFSKWSGATMIGANFAKRVAETGQWWTVDQILTDAGRSAAVLEWTRFDPSRRQILRGVDWFAFDEETLHIWEVRPYLAARPDPNAPRQELRDFDYAARGYPTTFPDQ